MRAALELLVGLLATWALPALEPAGPGDLMLDLDPPFAVWRLALPVRIRSQS